ncbi:MAG: ABC transporter substrate-binding protein [Pyrinomonadaceae bacterium]
MPKKRRIFLLSVIIIVGLFFAFACRTRSSSNSNAVTVVTSDPFSGLDTLSNVSTDAAADRLRTLMFNSLVKKNDKFEYVGDLAKDVKISDDNLTVTFTLQDNVKFHNGKILTSTDAKYTIDAMLQSNGYKGGNFYDTVDGQRQPHIVSMDTPDARTFVVKVARPALVNQLLSNLVTVPIIPEGTIEQQKTAPVGTGAFKFVRFDAVNNMVELAANQDYWEGAPQIKNLIVKTITDSNALQAELQAGRVDVVPNPTNFSAETFKLLGQNPNLQVVQTDGSNVRYIGYNVQNKPVSNVKLRQAIAYAVDRDKIINDLLGGEAKIAYSILPDSSWAYAPGTKYNFDPAKARQLLQESGYKGETIKFKIAAGNQSISQYSQIIQNNLKAVGINVEIEPLENNTLLADLAKGQFEMNTSQWVGGNQDPIFLRDLFDSDYTPEKNKAGRNRARYSNPEFDKIVEEAVNTVDKAKARALYAEAQDIVSRDLPLFPLWYPSNMVVASKRVGNVKINASGDWSFIKDLTVAG